MLQIIKNCFLFPNCSTNPQDKDDGKFEFIFNKLRQGAAISKEQNNTIRSYHKRLFYVRYVITGMSGRALTKFQIR